MPPNKKQQRKKKQRRQVKEDSPQAEDAQPQVFTGDSVWQKGFDEDTTQAIKQQFDANNGSPFRHAVLENLFNHEFLALAKQELLKQTFYDKKNDLYDFKQTDSLTKVETGVLQQLREAIYSKEFRDFMEQVTGIELYDNVDMSAASYTDCSYLLCHDDDLSERRIAYIIYLVPQDWQECDGGCLDLFSADATGSPDAVVKSLVPQWNSMAFFEVSHTSYHQVAEVLNDKKGPRLSISGWFHGKPVPRPEPHIPDPPVLLDPFNTGDEDVDISNWINPLYRQQNVVGQMREQFTDTASLQLNDFLLEDKYKRLMLAMGAQRWQIVKPATMRHYRVSTSGGLSGSDEEPSEEELTLRNADYATLNGEKPDILSSFCRFIRSPQFVAYLSMITGAQLSKVAAESRCFTHQDYSLICDPEYLEERKKAKQANHATQDENTDSDKEEDGKDQDIVVDATWCFIHRKEWDLEKGGYIVYLTKDEELLTVPPQRNSLSLLCKEPGILSFVKYVNHYAEENRYDVSAQYKVDTFDGTTAE